MRVAGLPSQRHLHHEGQYRRPCSAYHSRDKHFDDMARAVSEIVGQSLQTVDLTKMIRLVVCHCGELPQSRSERQR